jgi:hypothetical protein
MTMRPGLPEAGGFADRFQSIDRRLGRLERSVVSGVQAGPDGDSYIPDGRNLRVVGGQVILQDPDGDPSAVMTKDGMTVYDSEGSVRWDSADSRTVSVPATTTAKKTTTSGSFQTVATLWLPFEHPVAGEIVCEVEASAPGTEGEVRFFQDSEHYPGNEDITNGSVAIGFGGSGGEFSAVGGCVFVTDSSDFWPGVIVKVRRTAGAGTVSCRVIRPGRFS